MAEGPPSNLREGRGEVAGGILRQLVVSYAGGGAEILRRVMPGLSEVVTVDATGLIVVEQYDGYGVRIGSRLISANGTTQVWP
jgi:hypothetical protein